jgi:hypothetical protein
MRFKVLGYLVQCKFYVEDLLEDDPSSDEMCSIHLRMRNCPDSIKRINLFTPRSVPNRELVPIRKLLLDSSLSLHNSFFRTPETNLLILSHGAFFRDVDFATGIFHDALN